MKRLSILCLLLLVAFLFSVLHESVLSFSEGFREGWSLGMYEAEKKRTVESFIELSFRPKNIESVIDKAVSEGNSSAVIASTGTVVKISEAEIQPSGWDSAWNIFTVVASFAMLVLGVWCIVLFLKVVLSFRKSAIFESRNLKNINLIGIFILTIGIVTSFIRLGMVLQAVGQVELADYDISYRNCIEWNSLIIGLVILVFNEILSRAIGMKQEQDLTV